MQTTSSVAQPLSTGQHRPEKRKRKYLDNSLPVKICRNQTDPKAFRLLSRRPRPSRA